MGNQTVFSVYDPLVEYGFIVGQQDSEVNNATSLSPLMQFKTGISVEKIKCKTNLHLITKTSDGSPACVKPETKEKLIERGWAKPV